MDKPTHTSAPVVTELRDAAARDPELVGGKAASLARLAAAGLPVPDGFCVTTRAFRDFASRAAAETALPSELAGTIVRAYRRLSGDDGDAVVAVRSSGTLEDRPDASFAGQHLTSLGVVGDDALLEAVRSCWSSLHSGPALRYARARGIALDSAAIAVIVQRLVDADVSGIAFTRDPVSGEDAVVVDASWGLGEAVVSGWVTPDRYRLDRDGGLLEQTVSTKLVRAAPAKPDGREPVPDELAGKPCLDESALADVVRVALRAEELAGSPQDIEFALRDGQLWLLQARPISAGAATTGRAKADLEPLLGPGLGRWPRDRWTRAIADEYWADPVTPFGFGSLGVWIDRDTNKALDRIMGSGLIAADRPTLRLFKSHVYWNAETVADGYRQIPRVARTGPLLAYLPAQMRAESAALPTAWGKALRGELLARLRDRDSSLRRNHRALATHARRVRQACEALDEIDLDRAGRAEIDRYWTEVDGLGRAHFEVIRWGMQHHSLMFNFALARVLADWAGDDGEMFGILIAGGEQSLTLETNREIWLLAQLAAADAPVRAVIERADMPNIVVGANPASPAYDELAEVDRAGSFAARLDDFLRRYGHRGISREVGLPRWCDQPDIVIGLIAKALGTEDPARRARSGHERRANVEAEIVRRLGPGPQGRMRRSLLGFLLRYARIYTAFRENQRFTLDHVFLRGRRAALAYGRLLAEQDRVADRADAFFLTPHEITEALDGRLARAGELALSRRTAFERDSQTLPPMYLDGDEPIAQDSAAGEGAAPSEVLRGMPASAGRVTARCRVVHSLADAGRLAPGEVMVASNTDPGWTPLFLAIGAAVLETGGTLAHGAIVAREYGIPAVTAVAAATRRIHDGEWLTVDGLEGTVERHGERSPGDVLAARSGRT